ncbi:hypothetical protein JXB31_05175 [Candidatus Woesearchaeota archaeon]|nr:hypothetical protein [Candidatus Woesearchaeota archaeon]
MKTAKKASLSLSVNAIVVFVLAFAMLGVGLFFTNMLREKISGAGDIMDPEDLQVKPTSDRPLTIPTQVDVKKNKDKTISIGYFNRNNEGAIDAKIGILDCLDTDGLSTDPNTPEIVSTAQDVSASELAVYNVIIKGTNLDTGTYVCTIAAYYGSDNINDPTNLDRNDKGQVYESQEFFLNVGS